MGRIKRTLPINGGLEKADKSYDNKEFIHSREGRTLRILSEYLYPEQYFRKHNVENTVVFFGSARSLSSEELDSKLIELNEKLKTANEKHIKKINKKIAKLGRLKHTSKHYDDAVELARLISEWSNYFPEKERFYICTGGGPGMMEAANKGAFLADSPAIGLNISLPFEQFPNPYISPDLNFEFHYFFMRKFWFVYLAKAIVAFPGGFGTIDELMELLTLKQTGKITRPVPIVLYGSEFWNNLINFDYLSEMGMINKKDQKLFRFADTPEEAFAFLKAELIKIHGL